LRHLKENLSRVHGARSFSVRQLKADSEGK
jgi:hypothetical protein